MKAIQFEMWTECNVGCKYCYLYGRRKPQSEEIKLIGIRRVQKYIDCGDFSDYTVLAIIGGEFLQGQLSTPLVRKEFFQLMMSLKDLLLKGILEGVWLSASLTHNHDDLFQVLDLFKDIKPCNLQGGFWIITSYDPIHRFTSETESIWKKHMILLKNQYPLINKNTCSILTQGLVDAYLYGDFQFREFMKEYDTQLYIKPPYVINQKFASKIEQEKVMPGFFPKRKEFLKFLAKIYDTEECYIFDKMCNINFRADTLFRSGKDEPELRHKGTSYEMEDEALAPCGHLLSYSCYVDSDACILCDKHNLIF